MCGIAGIVARKNTVELGQAIKEMTSQVRHRGPDDEGYYLQGRVALGHRRLSIIDLSQSGHQPMAYAAGRYVITYNGEIYNYLELRAELEAIGFHFRSGTDTEVILAAYAAWGSACLESFNGMWAFAIHDRDRDIIFAARDRFGVKPFYYTLTERCFAFGSEIRQLLPLLPAASADARVVCEFLLTGAQVQSNKTFFSGVFSLLPGHFLTYNVGTNQFTIDRYYELLERVNGADKRSEIDEVAEFRRTLEDAVRLRLRSDVRVGTCLSGGLDSSSIAAIAARMHREISSEPFTAVTAVSEDSRNSEEAYAREVVRTGSLNWIQTRPTYEDFRSSLPHVVEHQEEPFSSPSICMQAAVMRAAKDHGIAVLLDGQGGDETLLGYNRYYPAYCIMLWRQGGMRALLKGVWQTTRTNNTMTAMQLAAYMVFALFPYPRHLYYRRRGSFMAEQSPLPDWVRLFASACFDIRRLQALEIETVTLPSLLRYEDKNSMAFSIETRLPFLDYRLVERLVALAPDFKMRDGWTKWVLRQAMSDVLPHQIAWRRDKIGFEAPTDLWLGRHLSIMAEAIRRSALVARFCDPYRLMRRYSGMDRKSQWRLYSLVLWEEMFGVGV